MADESTCSSAFYLPQPLPQAGEGENKFILSPLVSLLH